MPPASGIIEASSPYEIAAAMVKTPVTAHATNSHPPPPSSRYISAGTIKIPDPIMVPMTIMTESKSPSSRIKPVLCSATVVEEELFIS